MTPTARKRKGNNKIERKSKRARLKDDMAQIMWSVERARTDLKEDVERARTELKEHAARAHTDIMDAMAVLRADVERMRTERMEDMAVLQEDMRAEMTALHHRVRDGFEAVKLQDTQIRQLLIAVVNRIYQ